MIHIHRYFTEAASVFTDGLHMDPDRLLTNQQFFVAVQIKQKCLTLQRIVTIRRRFGTDVIITVHQACFKRAVLRRFINRFFSVFIEACFFILIIPVKGDFLFCVFRLIPDLPHSIRQCFGNNDAFIVRNDFRNSENLIVRLVKAVRNRCVMDAQTAAARYFQIMEDLLFMNGVLPCSKPASCFVIQFDLKAVSLAPVRTGQLKRKRERMQRQFDPLFF